MEKNLRREKIVAVQLKPRLRLAMFNSDHLHKCIRTSVVTNYVPFRQEVACTASPVKLNNGNGFEDEAVYH